GCPPIPPGLAARVQSRVVGGLVDLDRRVGPPGVRLMWLLPIGVAGAAVDLRTLVNRLLFDERQQEVLLGAEMRRVVSGTPVGVVSGGGETALTGGQLAVGALHVVQGEADLFEVVLGRGPASRLADFLDGRHQQADEDGYDGDHHQQFDERETAPAAKSGTESGHMRTSTMKR